jgi:3-isopropylmalate dehydrogenase
MTKIAIIPGDGIGIDVTREAVKIMETLRETRGISLKLTEFEFGAERYLKTGVGLPPGMIETFRREFDAIYLGALGDPRIPDMAHGREILLGLRFKLDLFINFRPVKLLDERLCPIKNKSPKDVNFVVFRENTEGEYVGVGGNFKPDTSDEVAIQTSVNTRKGVERIMRCAFDYARQNGLKRVTMTDKSNAMPHGHGLWLRVYEEIRKKYPEIESNHIYGDALCMQIIKNPEQFQVIVTSNLLGDIISDIGAQLQGGLGIAASANINPQGVSMFEPIHGSAPKYAHQNIANPMAAIMTVALLLNHLDFKKEAEEVENAVASAILSGHTTRDLGGSLGTCEVGDYIVQLLRK